MITTLTLNPAFDIHVGIEKFRTGRENLAETVVRNVGGKGINISLALSKNGIPNRAIVLVGKENGEDFVQGLNAAGLTCKILKCDGRIRENITIHPTIGEETRLSFQGFSCDAAILNEVEKYIETAGIVTFTGSIPVGISLVETGAFLSRICTSGAKVVIDSKSVSMDMIERIKPWLIKPNAEECETYFGKMSEEELCRKAYELHCGGIDNVMISLGKDGAILASEGAVYRVRVPKIDAVSTIGAGDSSIAGFIAHEGTPSERLKWAAAYGSAACLRDGTNPPLSADIERIYKEAVVKRVVI